MLCKTLSRHYIGRNYSSKPIIKDLNSINKALFGAVIKTKKPKKQLNIELNIETTHAASNDHDISSEMYWLLQHKATMPISKPVIRKPKKTKSFFKEIANESCGTDLTQTNKDSEGIPSTLAALNECILPTPMPPNNIVNNAPKLTLNQTFLKKIPTFPLVPDLKAIGAGDQLDTDHIPSVGKVLQATMPEASRKALMQWKLLKIGELGEDGFNELQKKHLSIGQEFHLSLQHYLKSGRIQQYQSPLKELWSSVTGTLIKLDPEPVLVETHLIHPVLRYKGVVDCVSSIDNELTVIEWKKSDRAKHKVSDTYDAPLQLCAYLGALNANGQYDWKIRKGLIVVAYTDGQPAQTFELNEAYLKSYWHAWLLRLQEYWIRCRDGTLPEPI